MSKRPLFSLIALCLCAILCCAPTVEAKVLIATVDVPELPSLPEAQQEQTEQSAPQKRATGTEMTGRKPRKKLKWPDGVPLMEGGMPIPYLSQLDYKTVLALYNGEPRSVSTSGCSVTVLSMLIAYLAGNTDQSPELLFEYALKKGMYQGDGLNHSQMKKLAKKYWVGGKWIENDGAKAIAALKEGKPVVAHMGPGTFTDAGHYILLRGLDAQGRVLVNDPGSKARSAKSYDIKDIVKQLRNKKSFMVCWYEPPEGYAYTGMSSLVGAPLK